MRRPTEAHVYSKAVPIDGGEYSAGHITFDEDGDILSVRSDVYSRMPNYSYAHRRAVRDAIESTITQYEPEETIIHAPDVNNPALEIGRLSPEVREKAQSLDISMEVMLEDNRQKLVYGVVNQKEVKNWYTSTTVDAGKEPYTLFIDGSHHYHEDASTISAVIADSTGCIVSIVSEAMGDREESLRSEFLAARRALEIINDINPCAEVKLRTDNNTLGAYLEGEREVPPRIQDIAPEVSGKLRVCEPFSVVVTDRTKNTFADSLADVAHSENISLRDDVKRRDKSKRLETKYSISD